MNVGLESGLGNRIKALIVLSLGFFGFGSILYSFYSLMTGRFVFGFFFDYFVVLVLYCIIFPKAVTLPSGSVWRPSIALVLFCALAYPYQYAVFLAFTGILVSHIKAKNNMKNIFISLGHLAMGILFTKVTTYHLISVIGYTFPLAFMWILAGLTVHFVINRIISALIVSYRKSKSLMDQIKLIKNDLNWGYISTYLLSIIMLFMYHHYRYWGILVSVLLLYSIYYSVQYFEKANELEIISFTDALTEAENRASWEYFKGRFPYHGAAGTFSLVDLDNFKGINDKWGHDFGDTILRETVNCLKNIIQNPYRVFRFGGDEFILYVPHMKEGLEDVHQLIHSKINEKNLEWTERELPVAISLGMKFVSSKATNLDELFIEIDQEMYKNKSVRKKQLKLRMLKKV